MGDSKLRFYTLLETINFTPNQIDVNSRVLLKENANLSQIRSNAYLFYYLKLD